MKNKKVFVSGGAGVIGSEIVKILLKEGAKVWVGDLKPRPLNIPPEVHYRQGDLNYLTLSEVNLFKPEIFIHLAATFERSTENYTFWEENFVHNVTLSNHLMSLMKSSNSLNRVVFASSYLIYDPSLYLFDSAKDYAIGLGEDASLLPRNLTGAAKFSHEIELRFLEQFCKDQFTSVSARIFRGYGCGSRCIISRWIKKLLNNEPIEVYRKEGMFDYIYARDIAKGLIALAKQKKVQGIVNLGTGNARRVEDVVDVLKRHFPNINYKEIESDISFEASQANMDYFESITGWRPSTTLEQAIPLMIEYERKQQDNPSELKQNILITSISKKVPMVNAVKAAAKKLHPQIVTLGADIDETCIASHFVDEFWKMPPIDEISVNELITYCQQRDIGVIIPSRDGELLLLAKMKADLKDAGISVMVSDEEQIDYCMDKYRFFGDSKQKDLPVIQTALSIDELSVDRFVVKERFGAGSNGVGLNLSYLEAVEFAKKLRKPIFQPYISGEEVSVDMYFCNDGLLKGFVTRKRNKIIEGESRVSTTFSNADLNKLCKKFASKTNFLGHIVLQVMLHSDGMKLIECNARFGGASSLSVACGLDSFYWFLMESSGQSIVNSPFIYDETQPRKQIIYPDTRVI